MHLFKKIVSAKRKEVARLKAKHPLASIKKEALSLVGKRDIRFFKDIFRPKHVVLIAEIKRISPSEGRLTELTCLQIANLYAESRADAISVLTEKNYFGGDLRYLRQIRKAATQPIFRKDFIIDQYQIYETFLAGADSFLLIASILTPRELKRFLMIGRSFKMEALVEIHNERDLKKAVDAGAQIIGINNRDLTTFTVDIATTAKLSGKMSNDVIIVSESGFERPEQIKKVAGMGVRGVLVGTSILKSKDPVKKIQELREVVN